MRQGPGSVDVSEVLYYPGCLDSPALLAASDGMNHQDFALLAGNFADAFARGHVKRLRAGLDFIFGDHPVYFVHVGCGRIVFEKCRIAVG